jgi:hypothetical protein
MKILSLDRNSPFKPRTCKEEEEEGMHTFIETLFVLLHSCGHLSMLHIHIFVSDNLYIW